MPEAFYLSYFDILNQSFTAADLKKDETMLRKALLEARSNEEPSPERSLRTDAMNEDRRTALELILEMKARGISLQWDRFEPRETIFETDEIEAYF